MRFLGVPNQTGYYLTTEVISQSGFSMIPLINPQWQRFLQNMGTSILRPPDGPYAGSRDPGTDRVGPCRGETGGVAE